MWLPEGKPADKLCIAWANSRDTMGTAGGKRQAYQRDSYTKMDLDTSWFCSCGTEDDHRSPVFVYLISCHRAPRSQRMKRMAETISTA
jgi:hypothetical protein